MNAARELLDDLAVIGATIEPADDRLILRAGPTAIPATLVSRIREAKTDILAALAPHADRVDPWGDERREPDGKPTRYDVKDRSFESFVVEWLNQHPAPSTPGRCVWCGNPETAGTIVLPFGTEPESHTWLHAECWTDWHRARKVEAIAALKVQGIEATGGLLTSQDSRAPPPGGGWKNPEVNP
jgi:hypothetical protein